MGILFEAKYTFLEKNKYACKAFAILGKDTGQRYEL